MAVETVETETLSKSELRESLERGQPGLENLAHLLANEQQNVSSAKQYPSFNIQILIYRELIQAIVKRFRKGSDEELSISYAAEWVLDNDYLALQALRQVAEDLPQHYIRQLPRLAKGRMEGLPRIYALAREILLMKGAQVDTDWVQQFILAYQEINPLTMGELWALPAMLRLCILQALVHSAANLTGLQDQAAGLSILPFEWYVQLTDEEIVASSFISLRAIAAQDWKDFFESTSVVEGVLSRDPSGYYSQMDFETRDRYRKAVETLARRAGAAEARIAELAVELAKAGQGKTAPRASHIGYYLVDRGLNRLEALAGYRPVGWERIRRWIFAHPTLVYLGSISVLSFTLVYLSVLYTLRAGGGFWQAVLAALIGLVPATTVGISLVNWLVTHTIRPRVLPKLDFKDGLPEDHATLVVVPALLTDVPEITSLLSQIEIHYLRNSDPRLSFALLTDFSDAPAEHLPEDDLLLDTARKGIEALNRKYPRDGEGAAALSTAAALDTAAALNTAAAPSDRFLLLHRERRYNPKEGIWMGWERKRGKLHQLNQLILAARKDAKQPLPEGIPDWDTNALKEIRYIITLDADTILPPEGARRLTATLAHPLNRALFDERGRVIAGYTILQPRTEIHPVSAAKSLFTRIFSGDTGLDLYTLAVSDVYQDLFGVGSYIGKGIYDVAAFEASLAGRVPENALLSHDLFEGIHGRVGLVTDIVLVEEYPSRYLAHAHRLHRWMRGDWQLLPWLFPRVPGAEDRSLANPLSLIDRWKILDNLRRSLFSPSLMAMFTVAWLSWLPGNPLFWMLAGLAAIAAPMFTGLLTELIQAARSALLKRTIHWPLHSFRNSFFRWLFAIAFLPFEAMLALDAISHTLVRLIFTRQGMLRWTTAAEAEQRFARSSDRIQAWREMVASILATILLAALIGFANPAALPYAAPLLVVWIFAPEIADRTSRPRATVVQPLDSSEQERLRRLARSTWLFFEQFIGPEDHWLPPDHFQESPLGIVAHRTSPTNIGLNLISALGAYDLGYNGLLGLVARLRSSFDTLAGLERYQGHFLNWYDTRSLDTLPPRYVSTVDSGNLAACLIALKQGLLEMKDAQVLRWETFEALLDSLALLEGEIRRLNTSPAVKRALNTLQDLRQAIRDYQDRPQEWASLLFHLASVDHTTPGSAAQSQSTDPANTRLTMQSGSLPPGMSAAPTWEDLNQHLLEMIEEGTATQEVENLSKLRLYATAARQRLENAQRELDVLHAWLSLLATPPALFMQEGIPGKLADAWQELSSILGANLKLGEISEIVQSAESALERLKQTLEQENRLPADEVKAALDWCLELQEDLAATSLSAKALLIGFQEIISDAEKYFRDMDFRFLFNEDRQVFHIGYNLAVGRLDANYYDLLASEARITSLVAIAKGDIPHSHWLHLARPITSVDGRRVLLSWSATMFEYLMPLLFIQNHNGTLLSESSEAALEIQMNYGRSRGTPWGISESGYYRFDPAGSYQYRAFGVPGLGYKRGLGDDLVIAPYASLLALPLRPHQVIQNMAQLEQLGGMGIYGLYEAIDFTPARLSRSNRYELVREYMTHHQGMIFVSLVNHFKDGSMVRRFHSDPRIQSIELLLEEQVPGSAPIELPHTGEGRNVRPEKPQVIMTPWRARIDAPRPRVHFLSNGRYSLLITASGGGYSSFQEIDLTRWRSDTTLADWGTWIYLQDLENGNLWSAGHLPTAVAPDTRDIYFSAHMAAFLRRDGDITTGMDITIAPEEDVEIRRITLTNHGDQPRRLRLTSYAEVTLTKQSADRRHPAFNKLFIESEWIPEAKTLLFRRRPRSENDEILFLAHLLTSEPDLSITGDYESDRLKFLGRWGDVRAPQALIDGGRLSETAGATLDPIMSLGQEVDLPPHKTIQLAFITLVAKDRQAALQLISRYSAWHMTDHAFDAARAAVEVELRQLGLHSIQLPRIQNLLSACLFPHASLRAPAETLAANRKGQSGLWAYAISGDYPVILAKLNGLEEMPLVQDLLQAHAFWRNRTLKIDLVFLNESGSDYGGELTGQIRRLMSRTGNDAWLNRRGGIFLLLADQLSSEDRTLLESTSRVILDGKRGGLAEQMPGIERLPPRLPSFTPSLPTPEDAEPTPPIPRPEGLLFDNGLGGFSPDGREYVLYLKPDGENSKITTPAPWINVVANHDFGCLVSEASLGYTWAINSGENRLTPWNNDPVSDTPAEAIYLRDEESANIWSPTPLPCGAQAPYLVRHGAGYSQFEHYSHGLKQRLRIFAAPEAPVKILHLRLENSWQRVRRITVTYFAEWVLGVNREETQMYILPEYDGETQALLVRNPYNVEFGDRVAFAAANKNLHGLTADRAEFLGRMGSRREPAALKRIGLAGVVKAGLDPCAALQLHVDLHPGEVEEVFFLLGQADDRQAALELVRHYQSAENVAAAWDEVHRFWDKFLGELQVSTPEPAMDLLLNRWLLYQTLACRIWGRSAFYQSSGAYGFRDQLQDVMALVYSDPDQAREHLLRAASHQFEAGDVLHWWHPPSGRGVRTRFSDDLLWLPFVTAYYVQCTGDEAVLDERVPFIQGTPLRPDEEERYGQYQSTAEGFTLFEHCLRAIDKGSTTGPRLLPLMGSGDWNDGMNRVGIEGRGESVWLAWFLIDTLDSFAGLCERRGHTEQAALFRERCAGYARAIESNAWDGEWYLRAFYDDGSRLGSSKNRECQIDSIAQSWSVLSCAAEPDRARKAMESVFQRLVRLEDRLILLFTPPFDQTPRDPGYIKGYLPGIRENGGQYTHAAIWTAWAFARLGQGDRAAELFRLLNPILRSDEPEKIDRYRVEPYVIAADIYSVPPHVGRGGWTWYTGSSGWMYRLGVEAILGLVRQGEALTIDPCIPADWQGFSIIYRFKETTYRIQVENPDGVNRGVKTILLDGKLLKNGKIPLTEDKGEHLVQVRMANKPA